MNINLVKKKENQIENELNPTCKASQCKHIPTSSLGTFPLSRNILRSTSVFLTR